MNYRWFIYLGIGILLGLLSHYAQPREGDNHGNHGELKSWFDHLSSRKGLCCSFADGMVVEDVDWDVKDNHFQVRVPARSVDAAGAGKKPDQAEWVEVPDTAVITVPNKFGPAVVWPYWDPYQGIQIRCFIPGAGS